MEVSVCPTGVRSHKARGKNSAWGVLPERHGEHSQQPGASVPNTWELEVCPGNGGHGLLGG